MQLTLIDKTQHYITKCFTRILDLIDLVCEKFKDFWTFQKGNKQLIIFLPNGEKWWKNENGYEDDPVWWVTTHQPWIIFLSPLQSCRKKKSWSTIPLNLYCYLEKVAFWVSELEELERKILEKTLGSGKMLFVLDKLTEWLGLRPRILSLDHPQLKSF